MKKLLTLLTVAAAAIASPSQAQVTDVSAIDNVVYIEPLTLMAGTTANISLKMKNTAEIVGYQCDIILPEGISPALDEDGYPVVALNTERTSASRHDLTGKLMEDGSIRILSGSQKVLAYRGNEGEVASFTVNVASTMAAGEYSIIMNYVKLVGKNEGEDYFTETLTTKVTVIENDGKVHLDENSTVAPESTSSEMDIIVKRTLKAGQWSTICLPFDMTEAQVKEAFGQDVQLAAFYDYTAEEDGDDVLAINVSFNTAVVDEGILLWGNCPYLIKTSSDINEFSANAQVEVFDAEDIFQESESTHKKGNKKVPNGYFRGTYVAQTLVPEKNLFLADNKFYYSVGKTKMKAFRGYFEFYHVLSSVKTEDVSGVKFNFVLDNNPTAIDFIDGEIENGAMYDLSGRKITQPKQRGIYIVNGKKVAVK